MKLYTKKGDRGETSLFGGQRLPKFHYRIEAYGTLDELNAYLGLVRDSIEDDEVNKTIVAVQENIFTIGSSVAADPKQKEKLQLPAFNRQSIEELEKIIDDYDAVLPPMKNFILPGGDVSVSHCHVARCVCRRAERNLAALNEKESVEPEFLEYINRLSDYLFALARKISHDKKALETPWKPF